ncbi:MAG: pitrilysin family protein [Melioribacteraceae bacterium]|nr:pitrilysin family protein [Melioribacteraceae bacterium]
MDKIKIDYEKFSLENGLEVVLYQNKSFPTVAVNLWYMVGSANEDPNKTGFAHLFEHMMFQGSLNVPKEMHFKYIQEAGGTLNGSTSIDRTNYYETLPSDSLELALWLESDRMGYLLPALTEEKLENQKDVVMNERRQNYDNQPYGLAWELLFSNLFPNDHPYHWPTIGWMEDIKNFNIEDVKKFFLDYYTPNNASLVIAGNFDPNKAKYLAEKYFAPIENNVKVKQLITEKIRLNESRKIVHEDNVQLTKLYLGWHSDKAYGKDDAALDILSDILAGSKSSRLYKYLVHELEIAQDVSAFQYSGKYNGIFFIILTLKPNSDIDNARLAIFKVIEELFEMGISESELSRAKNVYKSSYIYSLQNLDNMANQINNYNCFFNEPDSFDYDVSRYTRLTKADIDQSARKYLKEHYIELDIVPKTE